jgi:hypothetical protein
VQVDGQQIFEALGAVGLKGKIKSLDQLRGGLPVIDTLKITRRLEAASLPTAQAEAIAQAIAEVTSMDLATKADIADVRTAIAELKADLQRWVFGVVVLSTIAQVLVIKLWH